MEILESVIPKGDSILPKLKGESSSSNEVELKYLGPVKFGLKATESTLFTVTPPIYEKFKDYARIFIIYLDNKLDLAEQKYEEKAPPKVKKFVHQIKPMAQKITKILQLVWPWVLMAIQILMDFISEVQAKGFQPAVTEMMPKLILKLQPKIMELMSKMALGKIPLFGMAGDITGSVLGNMPKLPGDNLFNNPLNPLGGKKET